MAENEKPVAPDPLSPEERAHFDSRGEKEISPPPAATEPTAPAPAAAPTPPEKPADVAPPPADRPQATVPQAALHEERKRRQEAEEKARQIELLNARMEERFRAFRDALTPRPGAPAAEAPPPAAKDIFGAVKHLQREHSARAARSINTSSKSARG
jgi:hypothetical protein